jgi:hypothetical protein
MHLASSCTLLTAMVLSECDINPITHTCGDSHMWNFKKMLEDKTKQSQIKG